MMASGIRGQLKLLLLSAFCAKLCIENSVAEVIIKIYNYMQPTAMDGKTSVREYVFYVFFRFQKNMTFYVFLK